jgi:hypothetical protein
MRFHAFVLLAAPLSCLAQVPGAVTAPPAVQTPAGPKAPPEVDQALRARANAFFDSESKGDLRKAYALVAEDSKDYYLDATKQKSSSFTIDEVQYGTDLSTATVKSTMKRQTMLAGHPVEVPQLLISQWKLEKGEWVWYHDPSKDVTKTIIGDLPVAPVDGTTESPIPKDVSDKMEREVAEKIIAAPRAAIDKRYVVFTLGKEGTDQVTFHNSNNGQIRVQAEPRGVADTVTVEPRDIMVNPQGDMSFKITYKPHPESSVRGAVLFTVEPFGNIIILPVRLTRDGQIRKPGVAAPAAPASPAPAPAPAVPAPTDPK